MSELPKVSEFVDLPAEIDTSQPHIARMYDYYLGGKNHFAADRELADKVIAAIPGMRTGPRENREFLGRTVRFLAGEAGIRQFLDIGTGLPTTNSVHEVAQQVAPSSRVVYVDNDPLVLTHARALLTSSEEGRTAYIQGTCATRRRSCPRRWCNRCSTSPSRWRCCSSRCCSSSPTRTGRRIVATLRDALAPGSYLIASHVTNEHNVAASRRGARLPEPRGAAAYARQRQVRRHRVHRDATAAAGRGAGVRMAGGDRAAAARQRSELLRRGRPQALKDGSGATSSAMSR